MRVLFYLAYRTLVRSRVSFVLLLAAVTAGLGFQIPNTANIEGYTAELREKGLSRDTGHVRVTAKSGGTFEGAEALAARITQEPFVRAATIRLVHVGSFFHGERTTSASIAGIDPVAEDRAAGFCQELAEGRCMAAGDERPAVLGAKLAEQLDAHVGSSIKVALPFSAGDDVRMVSAVFRVVGVLRGSGGFRADYELFVPLDALRDLFGKHRVSSEIRVFSTDDARAGEWAKRIAELAPDQKVETWWEAQTFVKNAIDGNRALSAISTTMVVVAVMIPVLALLYIHVLHERRRIATIAALGFSRREIFLIHLFEALLVGGIGTVLGSGLGYALCRYFQDNPIFSHQGFVVLPSITLRSFLIPALVLFATTLLAGIVPAILASRAEPAVELRRE
ncbi:ABC transporter permease [Polyangium jinanense]|uniref:ABC transporter permease n=1 Tax=Polyangium jinanense TaxID=2829994 RepID=A0A9X4AS29_9BACT|nr:FtsX-like permease family protein [Polyangium jinanense]MDC3957331.1 ABC transporter permease [Polyangium jinanense]MDC3982733.1 ABC transporter permease [Polyangium jinanense]